MSKKKMQKVLALLLSVAMFAGLVGCSFSDTKGTTASTPTQKESQATTSATPTEPSETQQEAVEITYPLDTDYTFKFWANSALKKDAKFSSTEESPFHAGLSKHTGVKIEWEFPQDGVSNNQAFNLLLTEETLPDIIYYALQPDVAEELINDGVIWDLTEYLPIYAPDYWEYINSEDSLRTYAMTSSGKYYMICSSVESEYCITYMGPAVRKDWLDECGLDIPVTLKDWEEMLVAFKAKYGYAFSAPVGKLRLGLASGTGAYADKTSTWYVDDNGQVKFGNNTEEYRLYLETMNRWYEQGLIDPDCFTNDYPAMRNKCVNNEVGAMFIGSGTFRSILSDAEAAGNGAEWIGIPHPIAEEGASVTCMQTRFSKCGGGGAFITKECSEEELIVALQFLNYGYTEEGFMYMNYGDEGVTYTLDKDGNPVWTELITGAEEGVDKAIAWYANSSISYQADYRVRLQNPGVAGDAINQWTANSVAREHMMPRVTLTDEETTRYSDKMAAINTYVNESVTKFIIGELSMDKWDEYVARLEEIGLKECQAIQQAAYDRLVEIWNNK